MSFKQIGSATAAGLLILSTLAAGIPAASAAETGTKTMPDSSIYPPTYFPAYRGPYFGYWGGTRARYGYHPTAQGGTTGGTINPGVNGDHRSHGYNGG